MRGVRLGTLVWSASLLLWAAGCGTNPGDPVPRNRAPVVFSLLASPNVIGSSDSTVVTCQASDPDGDVLHYTWVTDSRLRIKGLSASEHMLIGSASNQQTFYYGTPSGVDSAWVECDVIDAKGAMSICQLTIHLVNSP
jgi:hypothetical protein